MVIFVISVWEEYIIYIYVYVDIWHYMTDTTVENRYFLQYDLDDLSCSHLRGPEITELSGQWSFKGWDND